MTRRLACLLVTIASASAAAQTTRPAARTPRRPVEKVPVVQLKVRPAPTARAAMRYQLLPTVLDQTPGNAAQLYYMAAQSAPKQEPEAIGRAHSMTQKELLEMASAPDVKSLFRGPALRNIEQAARREYCYWDLPIRTEHFRVQLPPLSSFRSLARILAARARVEIARGQHDQAIHTLQTGFAVAQDVAEGPLLIQSLVGTAVASQLIRPVEELIQHPDAPNLYWALTVLPRPFVDLRRSLQWEYAMLYLVAPGLRGLESARLTKEQWQHLTDDLAKSMVSLLGRQEEARATWQTKAAMTAMSVYLYPRAKRYLIEKGRTPQQVDAMPVQQAVILYSLETYVHARDELFKWFHVPYWQAREGLQQAKQELINARKKYPGNPFLALLPTLTRAYFLTTKLDQKIAALRCIEAVRMYAAGHAGKLPASLSEITEVPVPIDPVSGKPFRYEVAAETITLEAQLPEGESPREGLRYEVTFLKK